MRRLRRARHLWAFRQGMCAPPLWARTDLLELVRVSRLLERPWDQAPAVSLGT